MKCKVKWGDKNGAVVIILRHRRYQIQKLAHGTNTWWFCKTYYQKCCVFIVKSRLWSDVAVAASCSQDTFVKSMWIVPLDSSHENSQPDTLSSVLNIGNIKTRRPIQYVQTTHRNCHGKLKIRWFTNIKTNPQKFASPLAMCIWLLSRRLIDAGGNRNPCRTHAQVSVADVKNFTGKSWLWLIFPGLFCSATFSGIQGCRLWRMILDYGGCEVANL